MCLVKSSNVEVSGASEMPLFFQNNFQNNARKRYTRQIQVRLVEYSCAEVSESSEVPWFDGKLFF